ncbi:transcriptional regulator [Pseudoduganella sp. FT25W]|jgi:predicted XRE-type DNA-binding protein|uniref:Transcriptional regulator n=1 Tax=Duganella alba TaxID=2666081 RepID=A0A6L5QCN0_9BURK|nr:helix-turn-helix transcriptional regulator [Duganella alba]MRX07360.1 transcriptional regulator [Duganella alba]MRX19462.1 transcriptional regulator [Duganella alba]
MNTIINGVPIEEGSGNVYADLGYPDAEEMLTKAELVHQLQQRIDTLEITPQQAAELVGMPESWLSDLLNGRFRNISQTTIIGCLERIVTAS